ncbi:MAG: 3-oxoacyl-[acyl-carrier-protein] reductase [Pirellulales bacterium]|nr:3-oxoacyl-[acyl-carrier-protein] reductase [Pirellulales bacterium]
MGRLDGKKALVTGASRGIGRAIALQLAQEGAAVAVNYQSNDAKAQTVADEIGALGGKAILAKANLADREAARTMVKTVAEEFGGLDILVNNAGITRDRSLRKMTDEQWEEVIATNLNGYFYCTSAAIPLMIDAKYGRIVNISSMNGQVGAFGQANYSASKGGIIALTKTAAVELAQANITVNTVAPGFTETDMFAEVPEKIQETIKARIPMGRFGKPEEIAKAVTFLIADGDYITGQQINVNGGAYM